MKLVQLVHDFRKGASYWEFCYMHNLNVDSEGIEIYMKMPLAYDSDLAFFEIENTEGKSEVLSDGFSYFVLFSFHYFLDAIEESKNSTNISLGDEEIASLLFNFAMNDA